MEYFYVLLISFVWRCVYPILPYALLMFVLLIASVASMALMDDDFEEEPTTYSIADLESEKNDKEWVKVSDGRLYWIDTVIITEYDDDDKEKVKSQEYFVPYVSDEWVDVILDETTPVPDGRLTLIQMEAGEYARLLPGRDPEADEIDLAEKDLDEFIPKFDVQGVHEDSSFDVPSEVKKELKALGYKSFAVIEPGSDPASAESTLFGLCCFSIPLPFLAIWILVRVRKGQPFGSPETRAMFNHDD